MIDPHGGVLVDRFVPRDASLAGLPRVQLNPRQLSDAYLIAQGAFSPLRGFMGSRDYQGVLQDMHLAGGHPWSMPITLAVTEEEARSLKEGQAVALAGPEGHEGEPVGRLDLEEVFSYDVETEASMVYRTTDVDHPGVALLHQQGDRLLGGTLSMFPSPEDRGRFARYNLAPAQTRQAFHDQGWTTVVGFQTRNPIHRAHEYIQKCALEILDGLLVHPLVGETKEGDIPADIRMECYEALLEGYYPANRAVLSVLPAFMRYAGPREAIFHALVRKNYGCTHFIVGRDHAGVGSYYGPYDAHHIFDDFKPGELGITPLFFENSFYCRRCQAMASPKTCPHPQEDRVSLSGTQVRAMLDKGESPPAEFTRSEVAEVLTRRLAG